MRHEIKKLGTWQIFALAGTLIWRHFGRLLGVASVLLIPYLVVERFVEPAAIPSVSPDAAPDDVHAHFRALGSHFLKTLPITLLGALVIVPVTRGAVVVAIGCEYLGEPTTLRDVFKRVFRRFWPLFGTQLLFNAALFSGLLCCVVPGLFIMIWGSLSTEVVLLELIWGIAALDRSRYLIQNNLGTALMLFLLVTLCASGAYSAVRLIPQAQVQFTAISLLSAVFVIFVETTHFVFYLSCRSREESFDRNGLARSLGLAVPHENPPAAAAPSDI